MKCLQTSWVLLLAFGLLVLACGKERFDVRDPDNQDELRRIRARLQPMTCDESGEAERQAALDAANAWYTEQKTYLLEADCDSLEQRYHPYDYYDDDDMAPSDDDDDSGGAPDDYTETNVQEAGVDESDRIKTDGEYIYYLHGAGNYYYYRGQTAQAAQSSGFLAIYDSWPAANTREVSRVEIEGIPSEMYLHGDRVLVYSLVNASLLDGDISEALEGVETHLPYNNRLAKLTILDVTDRSDPQPVRSLYFEAGLLNSRRIGDRVFSVLQGPYLNTPVWSANFWPDATDSGCEWDQQVWEYTGEVDPMWRNEQLAVLEQQREQNIESIEAWAPDKLVGAWAEVQQNVSPQLVQSGPMADCAKIFVPSEDAGRGLLTVATVDLTRDTEVPNTTTVKTAGQMLYASQTSLYVTNTYWPGNYYWDEDTPATEFTVIHRLAMDHEAGETLYSASGAVPGWVLNQFSLGEYQGDLRIATTEGHVSRSAENPVHSNVFVLRPDGEALEVIGEIDQIAPTEQYYSARFMGSRGFLVTFQKVDPLFTVDLADPQNPRIVGELKIPGFSSDLHPLDANHLLAIGQDTEEVIGENFAWYQGILLSIFDVTDFANPLQAHKEVIGGRGSYSPAINSHKDFTYYGSRGLLAFPLTTYSPGGGGNSMGSLDFSGLHVYDVSLATGYTLRHAIDHTMLYGDTETISMSWRVEQQMRVDKLVMIEDYLYSLSAAGLLVHDLENGEELTRVAFDYTPPEPYYYYDKR